MDYFSAICEEDQSNDYNEKEPPQSQPSQQQQLQIQSEPTSLINAFSRDEIEIKKNGDLKKRYSWIKPSESAPRRTEAEIISDSEEQTSADDDETALKENECAVQAVDLVADCPEPVVAPPSRPASPVRPAAPDPYDAITAADSPSPPGSPSMGQRPSSVGGFLRPKISLTWVLRGQQHQQQSHRQCAEQHRNLVHTKAIGVGHGRVLNNQQQHQAIVEPQKDKDTNPAKEREEKERAFRRSVKSIKSVKGVKSVKNTDGPKNKVSDKENIERLEKHERKNIAALQRIEKIDKIEKLVEKDELNETSIVTEVENGPEKEHQVTKESSESKEKVKRAISEPNLITRDSNCTLSGREKHRHRRTKRSHKPKTPSRFGYDIADLDSFLTKASIESPANIPVVLSFPSVLYQTQGGTQAEIALPLGTVVNAVFKNQAWLYVQTPHGQEGYVGYAACLPLGILPQQTRGPCWEDSTDVFPMPLGNLTDTEKLRGDTRSECGGGNRERVSSRSRRTMSVVPRDPITTASTSTTTSSSASTRGAGERSVDRLYLRAAASTQSPHDGGGEGGTARHTLLLVREDYEGRGLADALSVAKGEVVVLLGDCADSDWFWVRARDGREGFIPAVVAGHGFL